MYLIGIFNRDYFADNDNPLSLVGIFEEISKSHLVTARNDDEYQVINLTTKEYYDPKQNKWIKIQSY